MNRDDVIRIAREAGLSVLMPDEHVEGIGGIYIHSDENCLHELERFAALVEQHKLEKVVSILGRLQERVEGVVREHVHLVESAVRAHEREECARVCDAKATLAFPWGSENADRYHAQSDWAKVCAKAIRARGNNEPT
jgi:hypothetical protein